MRKRLSTLLFLSITISLSAEIGTNWKNYNLEASLITEDYVPKEDTVLIAAKIDSNVDIKQYVIEQKFTNANAYERNDLNSLACLFLDLTGKSKGPEVKVAFFSWDDYFIMEIPVGDYKLHSMLYPPNSKNKIYAFEPSGFLDFSFSMDSPFVYIGNIKLLFDVENEFRITENRFVIEDKYLEAKEFLSNRIKDENGKYVEFEKALPANTNSLVFRTEQVK